MKDDRMHVFDLMMEERESELQRAYRLGLLRGINVQSMAQAKTSVLSFEDYGWTLGEE